MALIGDRLIEQVWQAWCVSSSHPEDCQHRLSQRRRRLIARALRDHPLDDVLAALRGWRYSPWHVAHNACDIETLLQDTAHIERFRDAWHRSQQRSTPPTISQARSLVRNARAVGQDPFAQGVEAGFDGYTMVRAIDEEDKA